MSLFFPFGFYDILSTWVPGTRDAGVREEVCQGTNQKDDGDRNEEGIYLLEHVESFWVHAEYKSKVWNDELKHNSYDPDCIESAVSTRNFAAFSVLGDPCCKENVPDLHEHEELEDPGHVS